MKAQCEYCKTVNKVSDTCAGQKIKCFTCKEQFTAKPYTPFHKIDIVAEARKAGIAAMNLSSQVQILLIVAAVISSILMIGQGIGIIIAAAIIFLIPVLILKLLSVVISLLIAQLHQNEQNKHKEIL